jgi:hypothetical protein
METHMFIKYFPETKEVVKYFMGEKYVHIEEISHHNKLCANDPNLATIKNENKWFEIYFPKDFVIGTSHTDLAKICESLNECVLPKNGLFAIVHEGNKFCVIWTQDKNAEEIYSDFVKDHVSKTFFY